jgi:mannose-6-phosphate isomerase-like protein (cupin superfamily)
MGFTVYDYREDIRNILATPQIRARFCLLEPGTGDLDQSHTHDLGHEIFIILSGRAEFKIDGEVKELGPGQMCYALAGEPHGVRVIGDEPVYMYLSVTPHIQPTHTFYSDEGERQPPLFRPSSDYDTRTDEDTPIDQLIDRHADATRRVAEEAQASVQVQERMAKALKEALAAGDGKAAADIRAVMSEAHLALFKATEKLAEEWNALAPRAGTLRRFY